MQKSEGQSPAAGLNVDYVPRKCTPYLTAACKLGAFWNLSRPIARTFTRTHHAVAAEQTQAVYTKSHRISVNSE